MICVKKTYIGVIGSLFGATAALLIAHFGRTPGILVPNTTKPAGANPANTLNPVPAIYVKKPLPRLRYNSYTDFVVLTPKHPPQDFATFADAFQKVNANQNAVLIHNTRTLYHNGDIIPPKSKILNVPFVQQMPQLPRGCEVTSLAMVLQYEGVSADKADKMTLATEIKKDPTPYRFEDGAVHFGNPNVGFVGSMDDMSKPGYGVYHKPIAQLAAQFFPHDTLDLTGSSFNAVKWAVSGGHPVLIITNATFAPLPPKDFTTWQTAEGPIRITMQEHSVVVTGYDSQYVYFNNPLASHKTSRAPLSDFVAAWKQMGSQGVTILQQ